MNNDPQQQLTFHTRKGPHIEPNDERIEQMIHALRGSGWTKRHVLRAKLGWHDRVMRAVKAASGGRIISTSDQGYCLAAEADRVGFSAAISQARSRLKSEAANIRDMLREFHKLGKAA